VGGAAHAAGGETLPGGDPPHVIVAAVSGYLQAVDDEALWRAGAGGALTVRMEVHVGGFVIPGRALASAWPAQRVDDAVVRRVRAAFVLGPERTPEQDIEYGLIALSDIGVRALSPGINDPTTAMHAIDRLTEVLAARARQGEPDPVRTSPDGRVRLVVRDTPFERAAGVAFDQIRLFGAANPAILKRLLESVLDLATVVDGPDRGALRAQADATLRAARRAIADPVDLAAVERLAHAALAASGGDAPDDGHAPAVGERT
jgi:uncharacterized membrane protein